MLLLRLLNSLLQIHRPRRNLVRENLKRSINIQQQAAEFAVTALRLMMDKEKGKGFGSSFGYIQYVEATGASEAMAPKNGTETPIIQYRERMASCLAATRMKVKVGVNAMDDDD
ncbi:hypothetical protein pipiens_011444 [Culex pipiens pipiens]|uniref:Uncharacterized protein n=1 Tax=Culex pipiens pipiens TaxID=38569 RepID=A0ABD1D698_CULPP